MPFRRLATWLNILSLKQDYQWHLQQMLQRLPIALAQVKVGNTSEYWLTEIGKIIYSLYRANKINKKVHSNIWI